MATVNLTIVINGPPSTEVSFASNAPPDGWVAPVPSGTVMGTLAVSPAGWSGVLALSGPDAASFTISGLQVLAAAELTARSYSLTVTATP